MTREEQMKANAIYYANSIMGNVVTKALQEAFIAGVIWGSTHHVNPWHKVSEELPKEKGMHLVCVLDYLHPITMCFGDYGWDNPTGEKITHWMEIPELPKED